MSATMTAQLVTGALIVALWRRGRVEMLPHHSALGGQYTSGQFQDLLKTHGATCSMRKLGDVCDRAAVESFFSSLKIKRIRGRVDRSRGEARADMFCYAERLHNPKRRHATLGYLSPVEFEKQAMQA